jgi:hypothetical protein
MSESLKEKAMKWNYWGWSKTAEEASLRVTDLTDKEWEAEARKTKSGRYSIYIRRRKAKL